MPRHARIKVPGLPLHVVQRGHNRKPCFLETNDYLLYSALLTEGSDLYACEIHAYVLMTNHVHLLLTPREPEHVSRLMKRLNERYVRHFNRKYGRTGSLWEGRFKASLIDSGSYFLRCQRYIELNPVRAGIVRHPNDYLWSSYRPNAHGEPSPVVRPHMQYTAMGEAPAERQRVYRDFVASHAPESELLAIRAAIVSSTPFGSPGFLASLPDGMRQAPRPPGRPKKDSAIRETGSVPV